MIIFPSIVEKPYFYCPICRRPPFVRHDIASFDTPLSFTLQGPPLKWFLWFVCAFIAVLFDSTKYPPSIQSPSTLRFFVDIKHSIILGNIKMVVVRKVYPDSPRTNIEKNSTFCCKTSSLEIQMKPYKHQVGGHVGIFSIDSSHICKPFNSHEASFYRAMPDKLRSITAECCYEIQIAYDKFDCNTNIQVVDEFPQSSHHHDENFNEKQHFSSDFDDGGKLSLFQGMPKPKPCNLQTIIEMSVPAFPTPSILGHFSAKFAVSRMALPLAPFWCSKIWLPNTRIPASWI